MGRPLPRNLIQTGTTGPGHPRSPHPPLGRVRSYLRPLISHCNNPKSATRVRAYRGRFPPRPACSRRTLAIRRQRLRASLPISFSSPGERNRQSQAMFRASRTSGTSGRRRLSLSNPSSPFRVFPQSAAQARTRFQPLSLTEPAAPLGIGIPQQDRRPGFRARPRTGRRGFAILPPGPGQGEPPSCGGGSRA